MGLPLAIVGGLVAAGFVCEPRPQGDLCVIERVRTPTFHYSQPIAILIPSGLARPTRLIAYLHGHRGVCEPKSAAAPELLDRFTLFPQLPKTDVLVMPTSLDRCATYETELAPQAAAFFKWTRGLLNPSSEDVVLAGHSGAYRAIGDIAKRLPVVAILLDASYTSKRAWLASFSGSRVVSVYRKGSATEAGSLALKKAWPGAIVETSAAPSHCQAPNRDFAPALNASLSASSSGSDAARPPGAARRGRSAP